MANSIIPATPSLTGVTSTAVSLLTTSTLTVYVASTTSPYSLDLSKLVLCFGVASSVVSVMEFIVGDNFSEVGQGAPTKFTVPTSTTGLITIGGASFESARLLQSDGSLQFYNSGTTVLCTAFMLP